MRRRKTCLSIIMMVICCVTVLKFYQQMLFGITRLPIRTESQNDVLLGNIQSRNIQSETITRVPDSAIFTMVPNIVVYPQRLVNRVDCRKLIEGDEQEILKAKSLPYRKFNSSKSNKYFLNLAKNCSQFRHLRRYDIIPISQEEEDFPIAFSILLYKDVEQAERLLRAIYRSSNIYCFHVDSSAETVVHEGIQAISNCFDNVFVVSKKENVVYARFTRLQADINCMKDLITKNKMWKYFINLPSQQFPLRTNLEIVKILKIYNGANDIEGIAKKGRMMSKRYRNRTAPPHGVQIIKGSAYGIFSRKMVEFILTDKKAKDILKWSKLIISPDEYYWAILNHNKKLGAPGGYWDDPNKKPWLATYAVWGPYIRCHGKFVRAICIFGVGDLTELVSRKELFANKFYLDYQPFTLDCLEEWIFNKSMNIMPFETFYYKQLPFINKTLNSSLMA